MIDGAADVLFDELDDDWDAVTFDDLYTPGSYWVNPPSPRTVDGRHADPWTGEVVEYDMSGAVVSSAEARRMSTTGLPRRRSGRSSRTSSWVVVVVTELGERVELVLVEDGCVLAVGGGRADGPVRSESGA